VKHQRTVKNLMCTHHFYRNFRNVSHLNLFHSKFLGKRKGCYRTSFIVSIAKLLETLSWIELTNCMNEMVKLGLVKSEGFGKWKVYELIV
jgi:hypothetical protein